MIGGEIRRAVFRDTASFYTGAGEGAFSVHLVRFALRHAGQSVLDLGCATGNYMRELEKSGRTCVGADVNPAYVQQAISRGLDACLVGTLLPFRDRSFDSVLMFEVAEHLEDVAHVLGEAARVARRNILLTVPNCAGLSEMREAGVVYEHFLELDHRNFFTPDSMKELLAPVFRDFHVVEGDPVPPALLARGRIARTALRALARMGLVRPRYYARLYVLIRLEGDPL